MKQMTCAQMGGPEACSVIISGSTAEEMVTSCYAHIMQAHPDLAKQIQDNTKEQNDQWMADFAKKFETWPEA